MGVVYVSELRTFRSVIVRYQSREIFVFSGPLVNIKEREKRLGVIDCIWSNTVEENWVKRQSELIADGKLMRVGIAAGLFTDDGLVLINNLYHPTNPNELTPASGIYDTEEDFFLFALREMGEELVVTQDMSVGTWEYKGMKPAQKWVKTYAKANRKVYKPSLIIKVEPLINKSIQMFRVYLDGNYQSDALVAFEFETGSVEFIFLFKTQLPKGVILLDGEISNGKYLRRPVGVYTADDLEDQLLTTKAKALMNLFIKLKLN